MEVRTAQAKDINITSFKRKQGYKYYKVHSYLTNGGCSQELGLSSRSPLAEIPQMPTWHHLYYKTLVQHHHLYNTLYNCLTSSSSHPNKPHLQHHLFSSLPSLVYDHTLKAAHKQGNSTLSMRNFYIDENCPF